jgi:hypothetical protein
MKTPWPTRFLLNPRTDTFHHGFLAMRFAVLLASFAALLLASQPAHAGLVLATDHTSSSPLLMNAGTTSTTSMTTSVFDSDDSDDTAAENLTGYQIVLRIVAQGGAVGTLTFATATEATTNYVFAVGTHPGLTVINDGLEVFFADSQVPFTGGVNVPITLGKNLAALTFTAAPGTEGSFNIVAVPDIPNTEWTDNSTPNQIRRNFMNVLDGEGLVVIGQVDVSSAIPEPGAFVALGLVSVAVCLWYLSRTQLRFARTTGK